MSINRIKSVRILACMIVCLMFGASCQFISVDCNPRDPGCNPWAWLLLFPPPYYVNGTDINGDGFGDFIVGASLYGGAQGRAYIYYGSPSVRTSGSATLGAGAILTGLAGGDGLSASALGDFNGDGFADLAISAPNHDIPTTNSGTVYIFYGGSGGIKSNDLSQADVQLTGPANGRLGSALEVGDFNRDGRHDLLVGANNAASSAGAAYVFYSSPAGISSGDFNSAGTTLTGENAGDQFSGALATADLNGDGYADAIVCAAEYPGGGLNGRMYVFYGGPNGLNSSSAGSAFLIFSGSATGNEFGYNPQGGDINGDGYLDLLVRNNVGKVFVYLGSSGGLSSKMESQADIVFTIPNINSLVVGDLDQDEVADIMIGDSTFSGSIGRVYYYPGRTTWAASLLTGNASGNYDGIIGNDSFGNAIRIRDLNGGAKPELIISAYGKNTSTGAVYIHYEFVPSATNGRAANASTALSGEGTNNTFGNDLR